ncbi:MAG: hypothetical protein RLZZ214_1879 [Verrucomicrobiota bacterium]|jgi:hypothetical protein
MPGLVFDGGDWLTGSAGMSTGSYTKIVRVSMPDFTSPSGHIVSSSATTGTRHALFMNATPKPRMWHNAGSGFVISNTDMLANTGYIISATYDSTNKTGALYLNGTPVGTGTAIANTTDATYQLGSLASLTTTTMRGSIGEVLIYNRVLDSTERGSVETYLQNKSLPPANTPLTDYFAWSSVNIPLGEDASATGDFNHNGVANLIEFALDLNPTQSGYPPILRLTATPGQVEVSYSRPTNRTSVNYEMLESTDMQIWTPIPDVGGNVTAGFQERSCTRSLSPEQRAFYKLRVYTP